jgi:hypothetical protein
MKLAEMYGMPKMTAQDLELLQAIKLRWNDSADRIHKAFPSQPPSYVAPRGIMSSVALDDVKPSSSIENVRLEPLNKTKILKQVCDIFNNSKTLLQFQSALIDHDLEEWF